MKIFMQLKYQDNIITDIITYEKEGYQQINASLPLPDGILGGWYRYIDNQFIFDDELYQELNSEKKMEGEV